VAVSLCGMAALHLAGISDGTGAQPQAAGALADGCAVSRACFRGCLTQGGVCLEEEKEGCNGGKEAKRWADGAKWGGSSGLNEACERAAEAASFFCALFQRPLY